MAEQLIQSVLGKGIVFPFQLESGKIKISNYNELIQASIKNILLWPYYSRYFMQEFGSRIYEMLEEPNRAVMKTHLRTFTLQSLNRWEPRISVLEVDVFDTSPSSIKMTITYKIKLNNTVQQLTQNITIS